MIALIRYQVYFQYRTVFDPLVGDPNHEQIFACCFTAVGFYFNSIRSKGRDRVKCALVIGNSAYEGNARLANPVNDANLIESALESIGFEVTKQANRNKEQMEEDIDKITEGLNEGGCLPGVLCGAWFGSRSG